MIVGAEADRYPGTACSRLHALFAVVMVSPRVLLIDHSFVGTDPLGLSARPVIEQALLRRKRRTVSA